MATNFSKEGSKITSFTTWDRDTPIFPIAASLWSSYSKEIASVNFLHFVDSPTSHQYDQLNSIELVNGLFEVQVPDIKQNYSLHNSWSHDKMISFNLRNLSIFRFLLFNYDSDFFYNVTVTAFGCLRTIKSLCELYPSEIQYGGRPIFFIDRKLLYIGGTNVLLSRKTLELLLDRIPKLDMRLSTDLLWGLALSDIPRFLTPVTDLRSDGLTGHDSLLGKLGIHKAASDNGEFQFTCKNTGGPIPREIFDSALLATIMTRGLERRDSDVSTSIESVKNFVAHGFRSRLSFVRSQ